MEIVFESLKCEVIVVGVRFEPYPSSERLIIVWLSAYPSKCRGDLFYALPLVRGCNCWREELCTPKLYLPKILSGGSLCGKSCVDELMKILLCEGGDVELCARTSKNIHVFAFDPLSLTLSLLYCALRKGTVSLGTVQRKKRLPHKGTHGALKKGNILPWKRARKEYLPRSVREKK